MPVRIFKIWMDIRYQQSFCSNFFQIRPFSQVFIVTGGRTQDETDTDTTEMYDFDGRKEWTILKSATLPNKMEGLALVTIYNKVYATG